MIKKINYERWKTQKVNIVTLQLDPENIRLDIKKNGQDAIINDLFANEDAFQIVKSIVDGGFFPDELPILIKNGKNYTVIEGNRRIASLKSLINPDIVPQFADKIKRLIKSKKFQPIQNIEVKIAPTRDEVMSLLAMKHTKITRRQWKPLRKAYFYHAQIQAGKTIDELIETYSDVDVAQFVKMWEVHKIAKSLSYKSDDVEEKVHDQRTFPISTLERLYEDPNFRNHLGFDFSSKGEIKIYSDKKEFEQSLSKVVSDIVDGTVTSRTINTSESKKEYLKNVEAPKISKNKKITATSKSFQPKKIQVEKKNLNLVPSNMTCASTSVGIQKMFAELQTINYRKYPNATLDLIRSFLECSLKSYFQSKGITVSPRKPGGFVYLSTVLEEYAKDTTKPKGLDQAVKMIKDNNGYFPENKDFLDGINHNPNIFAVDKDAKNAWDKMEAIFRHIIN